MLAMVNLLLENLVFELRKTWWQGRIFQVFFTFFHDSVNMFPKYLCYIAIIFPNRRVLQMTVFLMTSGCVRQLHDQTMGDFICTF